MAPCQLGEQNDVAEDDVVTALDLPASAVETIRDMLVSRGVVAVDEQWRWRFVIPGFARFVRDATAP